MFSLVKTGECWLRQVRLGYVMLYQINLGEAS